MNTRNLHDYLYHMKSLHIPPNPTLIFSCYNLKEYLTWTGPAAINKPASPPPITRPSGPANETLMPPLILFVPPLLLGMKDPDKESISKRPCKKHKSTIVNLLNRFVLPRFIGVPFMGVFSKNIWPIFSLSWKKQIGRME